MSWLPYWLLCLSVICDNIVRRGRLLCTPKYLWPTTAQWYRMTSECFRILRVNVSRCPGMDLGPRGLPCCLWVLARGCQCQTWCPGGLREECHLVGCTCAPSIKPQPHRFAFSQKGWGIGECLGCLYSLYLRQFQLVLQWLSMWVTSQNKPQTRWSANVLFSFLRISELLPSRFDICWPQLAQWLAGRGSREPLENLRSEILIVTIVLQYCFCYQTQSRTRTSLCFPDIWFLRVQQSRCWAEVNPTDEWKEDWRQGSRCQGQ